VASEIVPPMIVEMEWCGRGSDVEKLQLCMIVEETVLFAMVKREKFIVVDNIISVSLDISPCKALKAVVAST
jgi:hypothetical protein